MTTTTSDGTQTIGNAPPYGRDAAIASLLSGRRLGRNIIWNGIGAGVPIAVAVWTIPQLIARLGTEQFGLLALIWAIVGYFSLFDLGYSRALIKMVAGRLNGPDEREIPALVRHALQVLVGVGLTIGMLLALLAPWIAQNVLSLSEQLLPAAVHSFRVVSVIVPFALSSTAMIGVLQARHAFFRIALVQLVLGVMTFVGPLIVAGFVPSIVAVAVVLAAVRLCGWMAYLWFCRDLLLAERQNRGISANVRREMLRFGGWVTVTNVVGPVMVYMDRFFIAAVLTMTAVTYYTTPYEVVTRLWLLADAIVGVIFPAMATALAVDPNRARIVFMGATRALLVVMLIPIGVLMLFASEVLAFWLGADFAEASGTVLRWLAVGVFINCAARLPFLALHAHGRPDITAKLHLAELPLYVAALVLLVSRFGLEGAAVAWTLRIGLDAAVLFACAARWIPQLRLEQIRAFQWTSAAVALLIASSFVHGTASRVLIAVSLVAVGSGWMFTQLRTVVRTHREVVAP